MIVTIVQQAPEYLNLSHSLQKAEAIISEAAGAGAGLVVFGETWLTGYPAWIDHLPGIALWDHPATKRAFQAMLQNGIRVPGPETGLLGRLAKEKGLWIWIGVNEVAPGGSGTLYNSLLLFDDQGQLRLHHRKLMPTFTEKLLYHFGDGHGLQTVASPFGKLGGLICWEHWMPLTRQTLHQAGETIHLAAWPAVKDLHQLASRHYAVEGRCFVIAAGQILRARDLPDFFHLPEHLAHNPDTLLLNGGSAVIGPDGQYLMDPVFNREALLHCELADLEATLRESLTLDVAGHYSRPDVFRLEVNRERKDPGE